ncbi:CsgG/HfaB family protein [bacterium]|nr:CsgG/HfaB family protein [bacterium]NUN44852.1 curli production assembly protein CsgG [bacterium]
MNRTSILLVIIGVLLLQSCATVGPPTTRTIKTKPAVVAVESTVPVRSLKRKVAIARFSNETKYGQGFFYDPTNDRLGKQAMDILSSKLTATEKFIMLERVDLDYLSKEKQMNNLTQLNIPADYLILGSVTEFGRKNTSDVGVFSRTKKQAAYAKVSIRLVDVSTGQIVYSEEGEGEAFSESQTTMGVGNTADYDATLNDKVISAAISKLVNRIVENLTDKPWRSYILSYEKGSYFISGGEMQGIRVNDTFTVFQRGSKVNNPQTGIMIELPGKPVGQLKVVSLIKGDITTELAICQKVDGEIPESEFKDYYLQENQ